MDGHTRKSRSTASQKRQCWDPANNARLRYGWLDTADHSGDLLIVAMNLGGNVLAWDHPLIITAFVVAAICAALLILAERRAAKPIMPLEFLFSSPRGNLVFSNFFASMTMSGSRLSRQIQEAADSPDTILFNLPLYVRRINKTYPLRC